MSTQCPIPDCLNEKAEYQVMCKDHWYRVPKDVRDRVWSLYRTSPGSPDHIRAVMEAVHSAR